MSNFTPGPWNVEQVGMDIEISSDTPEGHLSVAWVHIGQGADIKDVSAALKDATLIAAAPDMYEALHGVLQAFGDDEYLSDWTQRESNWEGSKLGFYLTTPQITAILAALAKADGKSTQSPAPNQPASPREP